MSNLLFLDIYGRGLIITLVDNWWACQIPWTLLSVETLSKRHGSQHNDILPNDAQHNFEKRDTQHKRLTAWANFSWQDKTWAEF